MTITDILLLFAIMVALAAIPSTSVALVVTRAASLGVADGIAVAAGIVVGDLIFVFLAIFGLSVIAETMGGLFLIIKYIGGVYLIWLGFNLLKSSVQRSSALRKQQQAKSVITSFMAGLVLTLGDLKAIFFYVSLFPVFIDLENLKISDIVWVVLATILAVGGVKIMYAVFARRVVSKSEGMKLEGPAKLVSGSFMVGAGAYLLAKQ
jgi:threonine/homoserine/homoserine lactone efflux protein